MNELSTKVRPSIKYKTDRPELDGRGIDIHNAILKVAPKKGFVLPGHNYTGPGNPLESQLKYDPDTGEKLEIYQQPTGRTDAVSMQHDVDYSVCSNKPKREQVKCKNEADRRMVKSLDAIPWKKGQWGHALSRTMINTKQKLGLGLQTKNPLSSDWSQHLADELHKPITGNFSKRKVISNGINEIWAADLAEMQKFSKWNKGVKYLLMVIDVFSKCGWIKPVRDKKTETVSKAFDEIFKTSKRKPKMLWSVKGSEFISKQFKEFLKSKDIKLYHTENYQKSSVVERWNKTMKNKMCTMFSANNNTVYLDKLDKLVDDYNNTRHSSVKMTPVNASKKENEKKVFANLYGDLIYLKPEKPRFAIGDKVRISKYKRRVFDKG